MTYSTLAFGDFWQNGLDVRFSLHDSIAQIARSADQDKTRDDNSPMLAAYEIHAPQA
jgi:hypothetical protein